MKGTIRFELRKGVTAKDGKLPISLIYSLAGQRKRYSTEKTIYPEYWNKERQRAEYIPLRGAKASLPNVASHLLLTETEVKEINQTLTNISTKIEAIENKFIALSVPFSSQMVINDLTALSLGVVKTEEPKNLLYDFMDEYIKNNKALRVAGSLKVYTTVKHHLKDFENYTRTNVKFDNIDLAFFQKFNNYLIEIKGLQNTTIAKILSTLKTFLNYADDHDIKVTGNYKKFKIKRDTLEVTALTQKEFDLLFKADLSNNKRLEQVRDVFCFSCVTGLRYSDLAQLQRTNIKGNQISITVQKTKQRLTIPLNPFSVDILSRYSQTHKPLPIISNQKMNEYIKELCQFVGINDNVEIVRFKGAEREVNNYPKYELISCHTGRKTFATLSLERGMSAEEVMKITGHLTYQSFKRYVNITENRKKVSMWAAWGEPKNLKVVS